MHGSLSIWTAYGILHDKTNCNFQVRALKLQLKKGILSALSLILVTPLQSAPGIQLSK